MYIPVVEDTVVDAQQVYVGLDVLQGDDCRLLHDVTQIACQGQLGTFAFRQRCLDEQNLATYAGPCQSRDDSCIGVALVDVAIEGSLAQQTVNLCRRYLLIG